MTIDYRGTTALVTGASSGLGAEFAAQLARRGADLVLVARREDRLRELADRLEREHGVRAVPVALDLAGLDAVQRLRVRLDELGIRIGTLVNNAGFGMKGPFAEADPVRIDEMVRLNVAALVALSREFLPELQRAGRGALVNVASTTAFQPCPNMALYGATKAFVLSLTEALAYETRDTGLRVLALAPGSTRTEFFDVVGTRTAAVGRFQSPEQVVSLALRRLDRRRMPLSVVSGLGNAVGAVGARLLPRRLTLAVSGWVLR
jgi:short-subunit dehydrogenase